MSEKSYDSDFTYSSKSVKNDSNFQLQLLQLLKEKGVVDKLKTQVRQNLISEIAAKESIFNIKNDSKEKREKNIDIFHHASTSVIFEFLDKENFHYTKSVFSPESGVVIDKFYSTEELIRILQLDNKSEFYKKLKSLLAESGKSFLYCLMKIISEYRNFQQKEMEIQTDRSQKFIPLSEKMQKLDLQFEDRQKLGVLKTQQLYEDRIVAFQRDIEKRLRQEMENEIQRFKDHEILSIKRKEEDEFNKLLKNKSKSFEEEYQNRLAALKDRERVSQENVQQFKDSQERENYLQRQQILRDLANIQERELQIKKEKDRLEREFEMMKEQHKLKLNQVEERNSKLKELEMGIDSRITQEVNNYKLDEERRLVQKWKEVEVLEMKLEEEKKYVISEKFNIEKVKEDLAKRQCLFNEMDIINYPVLKQQNNSLLDQIEEMKQQLQQQNIINQQDKHKITCLLKQKMGPNFEQSVLTNELERARDIFKRERTILEEQKEAIEKKFLDEIKNKRILTDQLSQQQDLIEILSRQLADIKEAPYKNKTGFISNRSQNYGIYSSRNYPSNRDTSPHSPNDFRRKQSNIDSVRNEDPADIDECSLPIDIEDFTNDAKHKLMNLDEETEQINKAYHEFKNRLANSFSTIGEYQSNFNLDLVSDSFKKGLEEGRKIKISDSDELQMPFFFEPNSDNILFSKTHKEEIPLNRENNFIYNQNSNIMDNNYSENESIGKFMNENINYESESLVRISPFPKDYIDKNKLEPIVDVGKENDENKSVISNIEFEPDNSDVIVLNKNWIASDNNKNSNNDLFEIKDNKFEQSPIEAQMNDRNEDNDEDEIDPEVKKYMDLIKKKKETEQNNEKIESSEIKQKDFFLNSDSEEISEEIKIYSDKSFVESDKKKSPNQSDSESFW